MRYGRLLLAVLTAGGLLLAAPLQAQYQMERLSRGMIAVRTSSTQVYVGWRLFGTDPAGTAFNVYRSANGGSPVRLNGTPITGSTNLVDGAANLAQSNAYFVRPVVGGAEQAESARFTLPANAPVRQYLEIPLQLPAGGTVNGSSYTYSPGDVSVGDLDGDGELRDRPEVGPVRTAKDNSQDGFTGPVLRRRVRAERHAAVADQPRPQHPRRRALHAVPGLRLRRRRHGRGGDEDGRRHGQRHRPGHRQRQRRLPQLRSATSSPAPSS